MLVKQVIGSESALVISEDNTWVKEENASFVMNPPDKYAIEEGLTIKEKIGEGEVVLVSQGPTRVQKVIREGLAKGADRGIHIEESGQIETDPLSIAKSIVEVHGGRIWVDDGEGGHGSNFQFVLPLVDINKGATM